MAWGCSHCDAVFEKPDAEGKAPDVQAKQHVLTHGIVHDRTSSLMGAVPEAIEVKPKPKA